MFYRIFIAIELPDSAKKELSAFGEIWSEVPAKWVSEQNLHVTLKFFGNINENRIKEIVDNVNNVAKHSSKFEATIERISYGPPKEIPKYVWAYITPSNDLFNLSNVLGINEFIPHITLAKINKMEFYKMETPIIDEGIYISFPISSISIMESKKGSNYTTLKRIEFK